MTIYISIHALVKRATAWSEKAKRMMLISIHALVKRATSQKASTKTFTSNFYPRPREEGDVANEYQRINAKQFLSTPS